MFDAGEWTAIAVSIVVALITGVAGNLLTPHALSGLGLLSKSWREGRLEKLKWAIHYQVSCDLLPLGEIARFVSVSAYTVMVAAFGVATIALGNYVEPNILKLLGAMVGAFMLTLIVFVVFRLQQWSQGLINPARVHRNLRNRATKLGADYDALLADARDVVGRRMPPP